MFLILLLLPVMSRGDMTTTLTNVDDWGGRMQGHFRFHITEDLNGWECFITFSQPVKSMTQWMGDEIEHTSDNTGHTLVNRRHTAVQKIGDTLDITVQIEYSGTKPTATAVLKNLGIDTFTVPPLPNNDGTKYNYDEVLEKSILFYAAQRSGKLPADNPIPWRGDSALHDQGNNGEDLTGGWYDAGDNVKFGFPMSATVTILAWGLLQYKDAYIASEELGEMYDCIRWPLEWLLKCHTGENELYVQVGDGGKDHSFWGRPEDMTMDRPAFKITESKPGSDVAAEYAAAMAVGSMVFKEKDPAFAAKLLTHAKQLYKFAKTFKGIYSTSVPQAAAYYRSVVYEDELSWGAAWLYKATNDNQYLADAEQYYQPGAAWGQSWDDKNTGNMILLYNITKDTKYLQDLEQTFKNWMPGGSGADAVPYTPKGLAFRLQWGSLRYASNMAFMALLAADLGVHPTEYRQWAKSQIGYALGDTGRSFVVGFGVNPPTRPHHRASSCPMMPGPCNDLNKQASAPNPHTLFGALVGGPGQNDQYSDDRNNYINNEVACDYNAGFQSAVAGLKSLHVRNIMDK